MSAHHPEPVTELPAYSLAPEAAKQLADLYDPYQESCGFLISRKPGEISEIWVTPNVFVEKPGGRTRFDAFAIGAGNWQRARADAAKSGGLVLGSIHTHLDEGVGPSVFDFQYLTTPLNAVWHLGSGILTLFTRERAFQAFTVRPTRLMQACGNFLVQAADMTGFDLSAPEIAIDLEDDDDMVRVARELLASADDLAANPERLARAAKEVGADLEGAEPEEADHNISPENVAELRAALEPYGEE